MSEDRKTQFYIGMFKLQMSYLYLRLKREPWWGMDYGFSNFTTLKSTSKYADGPRYDLDEIHWRKTLAECWDVLQKSTQSEFVDFLWSVFGERWLNAYPHFEKYLANKPDYFGCFRYDYDPASQSVSLHFQNKEEPNSPLQMQNLESRREDLRQIIRDVKSKQYQPRLVSFDTWMNNLQPVLALFPESFKKSLKATEEFPKGYGWWGQFITKDGVLNSRRTEALLTQGRFEFTKMLGSCSWDDFKKSLEPK